MSPQARKTDATVAQEKTPHGSIEFRTHASDHAVHLRGHSAEDLFRLAAWALARVQVPEWRGELGEPQSVDLLSDDWDDLLVNWINELIALSERHRTVWTDVQFQRLRADGVRAQVRGRPWPEDASRLGPDVKAASYHGLEVVPGPALWLARVALDL